MSLLQYIAAALITAGSVLVLRAVWMADHEGLPPAQEPEARAAAEAAAEWREAA